jgi:hypothetical protein
VTAHCITVELSPRLAWRARITRVLLDRHCCGILTHGRIGVLIRLRPSNLAAKVTRIRRNGTHSDIATLGR